MISKAQRKIVPIAKVLLDLPIFPIGLIVVIVGIFYAFLAKLITKKASKPRLLWGAVPIISLTYMARALREAGHISDVVVVGTSSIYAKDDFDYVFAVKSGCGRVIDRMLTNLKCYLFFAYAISHYDVFHFYFDGGILRQTILGRYELNILKLLGKKIVLMPYGGDSFVYDLIPDGLCRHILLIHYPEHGDNAQKIQKRIRRMTKSADIVIACLMHFINLPRWDILPLMYYPIDTRDCKPVPPRTQGAIRIAHAPNHRGIKGTEFLEEAVIRLRQEGIDVQLDILEKQPNAEVLQRIAQVDIFVDQLAFGYALAAIEGMALGKVVISGVENTLSHDLFSDYSYLKECPIVSATMNNIYEILKNLIQRRNEWPTIGAASRAYVEKRHSYAACTEMFEAIYQKIWCGDDSVDLINFYHPLFEKKRLTQQAQQS